MPASTTRYVVASTAMLSFISFWRAAAVVLNDLGSSAYYVGGIAERAVGKAAPWFILGVMLFSYAVRAVYIESCSMFVRGGVYRVVHEAMGRPAAKLSVSALMFDYVLTGPIGGVSAGLYLAGLLEHVARRTGIHLLHLPPRLFAAGFAALVTVYFWQKNIRGLRESTGKSLRIMQTTAVMSVILVAWCLFTIAVKGHQPVPFPTLSTIRFGEGALGWLEGTPARSITAIAIVVGLGHSVLAMSGEETLAQVNRELEAPKLTNLKRTGFVIFVFSMVLTSLVSFFAVMLIPDGQRASHFDNLIGGLAMQLVGPPSARLAFHGFVVLVGVLLLSGAVNTSIIGANGVLNRVAEDGVLPQWFRQPSHRFGTTYRLINVVTALQLATIVISRGDVALLGEAYAFGVVWSFAMKSLAVLVLRRTKPGPRPWRVPFNVRVGSREVPVGLLVITSILFSIATINLVTKKVATISGLAFTVVFFVAFTLSERYGAASEGTGPTLEKFVFSLAERVSPGALEIEAGNVLCAVRERDSLRHLALLLDEPHVEEHPVVVLTVRAAPPHQPFVPTDQKRILSEVVYVAEKVGRPVSLLHALGDDPMKVILESAQRLRASRIVFAAPEDGDLEREVNAIRDEWQCLPVPRPALQIDVLSPEDGEPVRFAVGQ